MRSASHGPFLDSHPWWSLLLVVGLMLLGGTLGLLAGAALIAGEDKGFMEALLSLTAGSSSGGFAGIFAAWGFVAAGFIVGGWVGIALLRSGRPGVECPRCGTRNETGAGRCEACDLMLR